MIKAIGIIFNILPMRLKASHLLATNSGINTILRLVLKMTYNPSKSESSWQEKWNKERVFESDVDIDQKKFYCLEMYPYPSGKMHMGHVRNYSIGDAVARFKRATGFNVIYPMGFDSFGMPAENAAIEEGGHPRDITERNIQSITNQIKQMGFSYDWRNTIKSHDPNYYKWNQWFFLKFYEKKLAYKDYSPVNWCPDCATVLANEQVKNGRCWRCKAEVIQKDMDQWFLRITDYCEELLDDLGKIDYPENVKLLQKDWIGRSKGALIKFPVLEHDETIEAFTTRPDTIFGVTFLTLAPENKLCQSLVKGTKYENSWKELHQEVTKLSDFDRGLLKEKKGVFLGCYATNPMNGKKIPIYAGNFVLAGYGTGAVMAVPAHDQRDFDFAKTYDLEIKQVLSQSKDSENEKEMKKAFEGEGYMINSENDEFDGLFGQDAKEAVINTLEKEGCGEGMIQWKLRPWLISRQRYWGTPIPIINCHKCGVVPVPEGDLPVLLPDDVEFTGHGNPLLTSESFCNVDCPKCGITAKRETDTMDTFVDSSWYFLKYTDARNNNFCFDKDIASYWMNVDFYCGGIEHAQMHLIYARFWTKALRDLGLHSVDEPFQNLLCQGMVNKSAPWCNDCGVTLNVKYSGLPCPQCNGVLSERSAKMSKSLGNTVSPEDLLKQYGADTLRLFILFAAQPEAGMDWSDDGVNAAWRQLNTLYSFSQQMIEWKGDEDLSIDLWMEAKLRQRIREWSQAMSNINLREGVKISHYDLLSDLNWYVRRGGNSATLGRKILKKWALMLQPATPHFAEEIGEMLGEKELIASQEIKEIDRELSSDEEILAKEVYLKSLLEKARNVKQMAMKHLDNEPNEIVIQTVSEWKLDVACTGLEIQSSGENVKAAMSVLMKKPYAQDSTIKGEIAKLWKKIMPQLFKWTPEQKKLVSMKLDEVGVIVKASDFICKELNLSALTVYVAGQGEDVGGKAKFAFPLEPGIAFL